ADPYLGIPRTPEYYGKFGDANYRYVGGANPPWTAYDTHSMFLAQVDADGTVRMPSYGRPMNFDSLIKLPAATRSAVAPFVGKYMSVFPDSPSTNPLATTWWNPKFILPDMDLGGHVKNLEFGAGTFVN